MSESAAKSESARGFFGKPEVQAILYGSILALIPILWLDLFRLGVLFFAIPTWGGLILAAWILAKGGVLRPMRGILVGLAIGILAAGLRFGLARLDYIDSIRHDRTWDQYFAKHIEAERAKPEYQDPEKKLEIEAKLEKEIEKREAFKEKADWLLGIAYAFFCPIFLGLLGAVYEYFRQRKRLMRR